MNQPVDPKRLSESGDEVPSLLRQALQSQRGHGPNATQLNSLAGRLGSLLDAPWRPPGGTPPSPPSAPPAPAPLLPAPAVVSAVVPIAISATGGAKLLASLLVAGVVAGGGAIVLWKKTLPDNNVLKERSASSTQAVQKVNEGQTGSETLVDPTQGVLTGSSNAGSDPSSLVASVPDDTAKQPVRSGREIATVPLAAPSPTRDTAPEQATSSSVAEQPLTEVQLLRQAQAMIATNPRAALALCDQHARSFRDAVLAQEREVIAIDALGRSGRKSEAQQRAQQFLKRFSGSAHRQRIEGLIEKQR